MQLAAPLLVAVLGVLLVAAVGSRGLRGGRPRQRRPRARMALVAACAAAVSLCGDPVARAEEPTGTTVEEPSADPTTVPGTPATTAEDTTTSQQPTAPADQPTAPADQPAAPAAPPAPEATVAATPERTVWGMGDSLFLQCGESMGLGARSLGIVGWWGGTTQDMRTRMSSGGNDWPYMTEASHAEELAHFHEADAWVIGLGTNDVRLLSPGQFRANVDWFLQQSHGRPVAWFTIYQPYLSAQTAQFNAILRDAAARWANLTVIDWYGYVVAHPGVLSADRIHLANYADSCRQGRLALLRQAAPVVGTLVGEPEDTDGPVPSPSPITVRYGGSPGPLGDPQGAERCGLKYGGCLRWFHGGLALWSPSTGAHAITRTAIRQTWGSTFAEMGQLGYPVDDTRCGLRARGCRQTFETGVIYESPATGARLSFGPVLRRWRAIGGESGGAGYPTTNTMCGLEHNGCYQIFQGGSIYWTPATGPRTIYGAVYDRWAAQGWERSPLGYPTMDPSCTLRDGGCFQFFQGGSIYWTARTGAQTVSGAIYHRWAAQGWERGPLGYPLTGERCGLRDGGCYQLFQGGSVYWSPATGAQAVFGAIKDRWAAQGWERGPLGYPLTGERCGLRDGGCYQLFQGGSVYWSPRTGARLVTGVIRDRWAAQGWENGYLGYPTSDTYAVSGGVAQRFQGGTLKIIGGRPR